MMQLGVPGSSFSYFADGHFTVIKGRLTESSKPDALRGRGALTLIEINMNQGAAMRHTEGKP
jgi:hypothetical protein